MKKKITFTHITIKKKRALAVRCVYDLKKKLQLAASFSFVAHRVQMRTITINDRSAGFQQNKNQQRAIRR